MNRQLKSISEVVWFQEGPGVRKNQYTNDGVKLLNVANLTDSKIDLSTSTRYISCNEAYGKYKHFLVDAGDLIIASSGIKVEYFDKKMGFVTKEQLPLCMNTSTIRFKAINNQQLNIRYFMYYLKSRQFKAQLAKQITGSAQLNFGPSHLKKMHINLVDLDLQNYIKQTSQRYINNSYDNSYGRSHKISLENGKLSAIGDNSLAQCDVLKWKNVVQISTGEYHTVGLLENGTLVATGSNTNLQCEIDKIDSVKSISCGRYHTAILLNNGTVKILGKLSTLSDFAKIMENLYSDSMYDEDIVDGDKINAFLSALVNVDSDVSTWKNIKTIKSIYDGVIGIDNDNKLYICGNIGCNDKALMDFVKDY